MFKQNDIKTFQFHASSIACSNIEMININWTWINKYAMMAWTNTLTLDLQCPPDTFILNETCFKLLENIYSILLC